MTNKKEQESLFEPIVTPKRNFEIIEARIRREIYNGALVPGQKLPNEFELARQFNVGRSAISTRSIDLRPMSREALHKSGSAICL